MVGFRTDAVRHEVAGTWALDGLAGCLLVASVTRHEPAEAAVGHVHKTRAVDPARRHAAPEVRRPEIGSGLRDRVAVPPLGQPVPRRIGRERRCANPAGIVVRRLDPRPVAATLADAQRLTAQDPGSPAPRLRRALREPERPRTPPSEPRSGRAARPSRSSHSVSTRAIQAAASSSGPGFSR